jgi:hypothetical protein
MGEGWVDGWMGGWRGEEWVDRWEEVGFEFAKSEREDKGKHRLMKNMK